MQVLSILQDASLESAAKAKKNYGNTLTAEGGCPRQYRRCFRICLQVHRHDILARMGGRDLHRALAVSSTRFRAHQCGRALSASLAGRGARPTF